MAAVANIPPLACLRPPLLHSSGLKIGTTATPMGATSTTPAPVPHVHNPVNITNDPPPGPTLWEVTTRGYTKLYSHLPLADTLWLHALPFPPPTAHPHLVDAVQQQWIFIPHCPRQLGLQLACSCLPMCQQHSSSPTRNICDGKHHGVQQWF
jgi:hypothetical protein